MKARLPLTIPALAAMAAVFIVAVGGYVGLVAPKRREVARLEVQLKAALMPPAAVSTSTPITDEERAMWKIVQQQVRQRFVAPENQLRLLVKTGQLARSVGLTVTDLQIQNTATPAPGAPPAPVGVTPPPAASLMFAMPPNLAVNPGVIRVTARHRYRDVVTFLERVRSGNAYVALQALDIRRVDTHLESDIRLASLRWVEQE